MDVASNNATRNPADTVKERQMSINAPVIVPAALESAVAAARKANDNNAYMAAEWAIIEYIAAEMLARWVRNGERVAAMRPADDVDRTIIRALRAMVAVHVRDYTKRRDTAAAAVAKFSAAPSGAERERPSQQGDQRMTEADLLTQFIESQPDAGWRRTGPTNAVSESRMRSVGIFNGKWVMCDIGKDPRGRQFPSGVGDSPKAADNALNYNRGEALGLNDRAGWDWIYRRPT
jgi:hypothetical protein